ncbi:MAG TPA: hypothetical protein VF482_07935 [Trebonia sp.]
MPVSDRIVLLTHRHGFGPGVARIIEFALGAAKLVKSGQLAPAHPFYRGCFREDLFPDEDFV